MSVLRAGNTTLEDGKVRICVPIAYETEKEILEESVRIGKSSVADIAEWRIDWYQDVFQPRKRNALAKKIRENIKRLSDDFTNGKFRTIEEFNTMPCGTIFLSGVWIQPDHNRILKDIALISDKLKGKQVHVICVTHRSTDLFMRYIGLR